MRTSREVSSLVVLGERNAPPFLPSFPPPNPRPSLENNGHLFHLFRAATICFTFLLLSPSLSLPPSAGSAGGRSTPRPAATPCPPALPGGPNSLLYVCVGTLNQPTHPPTHWVNARLLLSHPPTHLPVHFKESSSMQGLFS